MGASWVANVQLGARFAAVTAAACSPAFPACPTCCCRLLWRCRGGYAAV